MSNEKQGLFRNNMEDRITSPEQLTDYLRVTNPGIWVVLTAVILILAGIIAWSMAGTLETQSAVSVVVTDHTARIIPSGAAELEEGMPLRVSGQEFLIAFAEKDEFGRSVGTAEVGLPDGTYEGTVITETVHPISFLLESQ